MFKFDTIIMNPPYQGTRRLHQKFFNKGVEVVKDNGKVISIHPATPYFNKKPLVSDADKAFAANIKQYDTSVQIYPSNVFGDGAEIATGIAMTALTKTKTETSALTKVTYENDRVFYDVSLADMSMTQIAVDELRPIRIKFAKYAETVGNMQDHASLDKPNDKKARLQKIRGHVGTDDWNTLVSRNTKYYTGNGDFGVKVKNATQRENFYEYAKSNVARFGLALMKFNYHLDSGELTLVPWFDLDYKYEEEYLYEALGLTKKEIKIIEDFLPEYYD